MSHGVNIEEQPTGVVPPVAVDSALPTYVGTAPVNLGDESFVNTPGLFSTLAEFSAKCGDLGQVDSSLWDQYTLHEAASAHFSVYGAGPIVCINVLDPSKSGHKTPHVGESHTFTSTDEVTLNRFAALKSSVAVKVSASVKALGTDYTLAFDDAGMLVVSRVSSGTIAALATITVDYSTLEPEAIHEADIIGGYSAGKYTGLEVVQQVFPKLRRVPCFILAPKWSQQPTVAARMAAIAHSINGSFRAEALTDLTTEPYLIATYADAPAWKADNGFTSVDQVALWPKGKSGNDVYHLSTIMACVAALTDDAHDGLPFASPSNKSVTATSAVLDDGTEVFLDRLQANSLNDQGIVTILNGFNGFKLWGNRTSVYPGSTDPKDSFIPIRRFFNFIENTIILTTDRDVDEPGNKRQIEGVVGTIQSLINGYIAAGALVDGKIEFRKDENSTTDLADGKIKYHVTLTPPSPAEDITFVVEYDPAALAALFA
jgi:phage tail sheath protein FI